MCRVALHLVSITCSIHYYGEVYNIERFSMWSTFLDHFITCEHRVVPWSLCISYMLSPICLEGIICTQFILSLSLSLTHTHTHTQSHQNLSVSFSHWDFLHTDIQTEDYESVATWDMPRLLFSTSLHMLSLLWASPLVWVSPSSEPRGKLKPFLLLLLQVVSPVCVGNFIRGSHSLTIYIIDL